VSTPWGIELEENIIVVVENDIFVVVGYDNLDRAFLLLRNGLGLDARIDLAVEETLDEMANIIMSDLLGLIEGEFLILLSLLDGERGPFAILQVEVLGVGAKGLGVDGGEVDRTLVFLSQGLEFFSDLGPLLFSFSEDIGEREVSLGGVNESSHDSCEGDLRPCSQHTSQGRPLQPVGWRHLW